MILGMAIALVEASLPFLVRDGATEAGLACSFSRSSISVSTTAGAGKPGALRPARYASIVAFCTSRNACMVCWNDSMARSVELGDGELVFMGL